VDLHPTNLGGFDNTFALGISGAQQVGYGYGSRAGSSGYYALLWNGSADSAVDLHPTSEFSNSSAFDTDGAQQVGNGIPEATNTAHALLWSGTATSAVDLHPTHLADYSNSAGFSQAYGVQGGQQVGVAYSQFLSVKPHAILWSGTADSAVDLHPTNLSGFELSTAYDTNGSLQVGFGYQPLLGGQALLWSGTANSAVNLHNLLPQGFTSSEAHSIDAQGIIYGWGWGPDNNLHVVMWTPVPEPSSTLLLAIAFATTIPLCRGAAKNRC